MNNKFALSFGVSLMIVGFLNIFFETSNLILLGLSISTTIFSIINIIVPNIKSTKAEFIYILPFVILVSIFCYNGSLMKYDFIKELVNGKTTSVLTFVSFGFLFISEFINHTKNNEKQKEFEIAQTAQNIEYSELILMLVNKYLSNISNKGIKIDIESRNFLNEITALCEEKTKLSGIDVSLLSLNKEEYTLEDVNEAFKSRSETINYEEVSKKYRKEKKNKSH